MPYTPNDGDMLTNVVFGQKMDIANKALQHCGAMLQVLSRDKIVSSTMDWEQVTDLVMQGLGPTAFPIGTQLIEKWTDHSVDPAVEYECPFNVTNFGPAELESGYVVPGMYLQMHWCTKDGIQFNHDHGFYKVGADGLAAGDYCVKMVEASVGQPANTYFCFTLSEAAPEGAVLTGFHYNENTNVSVWNNPADATATQTVTATASETEVGTLLGTLSNSSSTLLTNRYATIHGYNRWGQSAVRQYLNSNKGKGQWWTPQNDGDVRPDQLASVVGFMQGFSDEFLNAIGKVKVATATNTATDGGVTEYTYDKFFLPSLEQEYIVPQASGIEGDFWPYWKAVTGKTAPEAQYSTNTNRIRYTINNHTSANNVWLRSAFRGSSGHVWSVNSSGNVSYYGAFCAFRLAPACVICGKAPLIQ